MVKLYISLPYSKIDKELSFRVANAITAHYIKQGFNIFSPISHSHIIAKTCGLPDDAEFWEQSNHEFIDWCDQLCVVKLQGWEESTGVMDEIQYAQMADKLVFSIDPWEILDKYDFIRTGPVLTPY